MSELDIASLQRQIEKAVSTEVRRIFEDAVCWREALTVLNTERVGLIDLGNKWIVIVYEASATNSEEFDTLSDALTYLLNKRMSEPAMTEGEDSQ